MKTYAGICLIVIGFFFLLTNTVWFESLSKWQVALLALPLSIILFPLVFYGAIRLFYPYPLPDGEIKKNLEYLEQFKDDKK